MLVVRVTRKVDVRLPGKGSSNSHGARPVHLTITMIKWIRTSRLSIKNPLSWRGSRTALAVPHELLVVLVVRVSARSIKKTFLGGSGSTGGWWLRGMVMAGAAACPKSLSHTHTHTPPLSLNQADGQASVFDLSTHLSGSATPAAGSARCPSICALNQTNVTQASFYFRSKPTSPPCSPYIYTHIN